MKRKISLLVLVLLALSTLLSACQKDPPAPPVFIESTGGSYEVVDVRLEEQDSGQAAPEGSAYLLITVQGGKADMEDMESTFFGLGKQPSTVSTGTYDVECSKIRYGTMTKEGEPDVLGTMVFEVPTDFPGDFTFQANNADPVLLAFETEEKK